MRFSRSPIHRPMRSFSAAVVRMVRALTSAYADYPAPEETFAGYPTRSLAEDDRVESAPDAEARLGLVRGLPLTCYSGEQRSCEEHILRAILAEAARPRTIAQLDAVLVRLGVARRRGRATLAWMLKYALLRVVG